MPGYALEKNWDRWWRLVPRFESQFVIHMKIIFVAQERRVQYEPNNR